tara:strand:+ start:1472 stop:1684 length:213 start_codon:yes stop_codon:yes gene_type:complete
MTTKLTECNNLIIKLDNRNTVAKTDNMYSYTLYNNENMAKHLGDICTVIFSNVDTMYDAIVEILDSWHIE